MENIGEVGFVGSLCGFALWVRFVGVVCMMGLRMVCVCEVKKYFNHIAF